MALYGYKISGFARSERYFEAEALLDRKLKGFEKLNSEFSEDGSRSQVYRKTDEDGNVTEVRLVKNVTESGTMVFSDIPLKFLKLGRYRFYLRDIFPALFFIALYWGGLGYILQRTELAVYSLQFNVPTLIGSVIALTAGVLIINAVTAPLLKKNRSVMRIKVIQYGSVATVLGVLYYLTRIFDYWTPEGYGYRLLHSPLTPLLLSALINFLVVKYLNKKK